MREIRVSCPDQTGLGVDVFRVLLDFGLRVLKADICTDGGWCLLVLTVALSGAPPRWSLLSARLLEVCPTDTDALRLLCPSTPKQRTPYAVHVVSGHDRQGMLHSLAHALWEADTAVFKAHVTTAPSGEVRDTFWLYDNRDELSEPHRMLEICDRVKGALGPDVVVDVEPAPPSAVPGLDDSSSLPAPSSSFLLQPLRGSGASLYRMGCKDVATSQANLRAIINNRRSHNNAAVAAQSNGGVAADGGEDQDDEDENPTPTDSTGSDASVRSLSTRPDTDTDYTHHHHHRRDPSRGSVLSAASAELFPSTDVEVEVDHAASGSHTLLSLRCKDRKGLLYDLLLKFKEVNVRVAFGRVDVDPETGDCTADLYIQDSEYEAIVDHDVVEELVDRVREAAALPVRIAVQDVMGGAATELTVAANVDVGGRGRPRVTFDVTQGLCAAGLGVACADVYVEACEPLSPFSNSMATAEEIHRFLVHMPQGGGLESDQDRTALAEVIRASLLGIKAPPGPVARLLNYTTTAGTGSGSGAGDEGGENVNSNTTTTTTAVLNVRDRGGGVRGGVGARSPALLRSMSEAWKGTH